MDISKCSDDRSQFSRWTKRQGRARPIVSHGKWKHEEIQRSIIFPLPFHYIYNAHNTRDYKLLLILLLSIALLFRSEKGEKGIRRSFFYPDDDENQKKTTTLSNSCDLREYKARHL